jgi:hypothetical protein
MLAALPARAVSARYGFDEAYDNVAGGDWYCGENNERALPARLSAPAARTTPKRLGDTHESRTTLSRTRSVMFTSNVLSPQPRWPMNEP